jgi:peptidoglycan lytic transglycosylase
MIDRMRRKGTRALACALIGLIGAAPAQAVDGPARAVDIDASARLKSLDSIVEGLAADAAAAPEDAVAPEDVVATPQAFEPAGQGEASYYGAELAGNRTASGERFNPAAFTCAHRSLPLGSMVRVTNVANGRSVVVRVNDRGPFARGRIIDVSLAAAREIGLVRAGRGQVRLDLVHSIA